MNRDVEEIKELPLTLKGNLFHALGTAIEKALSLGCTNGWCDPSVVVKRGCWEVELQRLVLVRQQALGIIQGLVG